MKKLIAITIAAAAFAVHAGVGATTKWTSNYVQRVVNALPQGTGISADEARRMVAGVLEQILKSTIESGGQDGAYADDFTTGTNGVTKLYQVVQSNGVPVVVKREFDLRVSLVYSPPYQGAVIVSSALAEFPKGTIYATTSCGTIECKSITRAQSWFHISDLPDGSAEITYEGGSETYSSLFMGDRIMVGKYTPTADGPKLVGTFTMAPIRLTEAQLLAATDSPNGNNRWCNTATNATAKLRLEWYPKVQPLAASRALRASGSNASGSVEIPLDYRGPGMVNYNEQYKDSLGEPDEDGDYEYEWVPSVGYPMYSWDEPGNWYTDLPVTATFTQPNDQGGTDTFTKTIPNDAAFRAVLANYSIQIPPIPYNYPQLRKKAKFKCKKYGHIWVSGCVCKVCGEQRAHDIPSIDPTESACSTCVNKLTKMERTSDGDYRVVETDEECGATGTDYDESKHAGWHHTGPRGVDGQSTPVVYCSCACGIFGEGKFVLNHQKTETGDAPEQVDEYQHRKKFICTRGNCQFEMYEYESHNVGPNSDASNLRYIDAYFHAAVGECEDCHAEIESQIEHYWGYYGGGMDTKCKCPCFISEGDSVGDDGTPSSTIHEWGTYTMINEHEGGRTCDLLVCMRCGRSGHRSEGSDVIEPVDGEGDSDHHGCWMTDGRKGTENADCHWCNCAGFSEAHGFSSEKVPVCDGGRVMVAPFTQTKLGGCGYSQKTGGGDGREGNDSTSTDPNGPTCGPDGPSFPNGPNGPVPPQPPTPPNPPSPPTPPPGPDTPNPPNPTPPVPPYPPFNPPPSPYYGGGGNSGTVDPNSVTNNWPHISAPYPGPKGPPPPWTL